MRGVFAIPPTPFDPTGALDLAGLRNVVDFSIQAGAHGIVAPVNASEFTTLTDEERLAVAATVVESAAGRVPVIIGVSGVTAEHAELFTRHAVSVGADAVIAMPPYVLRAGPTQIHAYYRRVAEAAHGQPVWIQNHVGPVGTPMSPETLVALLDIDGVDYIKEECIPAGHYMSETMALAGEKLRGIMGGMAGRYLLDEYARGSCGTMPACEITDLHVDLWDRLEAGDQAGAATLFTSMLPLLNIEHQYGVAVYKEVLSRRGVLRSTFAREPGAAVLDDHDQRELDRILATLEPLFRVRNVDAALTATS